ncbi:alpha/beta hydrolase [Marinomonas sp. TI.3.20]|uniref:alpha/beta hydrolase n=1 Tax=Marinomonas sp. TI.3.20 TaxID=3121296 RepID=UPI00311D41D1
MKKLLVALSSLLLLGCARTGLELANLPSKFSDTDIIRNVAYGHDAWQKLDIYIPKHAKGETLPVVVFFYGGSWQDGSKDMYAFVGDAFAQKKYIAVIVDYSKYPQVVFPQFVNDGAKAVAWVYRNIEKYSGNPNDLFLSGHSAGAHIAALIAADHRYLQKEGLNTSVIKAFAGMSGPYDFVPKEETYKAIFGPPENYPQMQVTTFIDGREPPMLLLWGEKDTLVGRSNMDLLADKIRQQQGVVETKIYPNVDHVGMVSSFTWFLRGKASVLEDICQFFGKYQ